MITLDGSYGEGGGQILRSALALSLVTGKPFRIYNIRANRSKPGLMRQHLTGVLAAKEVGEANVDGAEIGSNKLDFRPKTIKAGNYRFAVGTAGSATLVLQTVLPALLIADAPTTVSLEGGTHNPFAPPFDFLRDAFLPCIKKMGPSFDTAFKRYGFYPAGGGKFSVSVIPTKKLGTISFTSRGKVTSIEANAVVTGLSVDIANKEIEHLKRVTQNKDMTFKTIELTNAHGVGNVMIAKISSEHITEVMTSFGEVRKSAKKVAKEAANEINRYLKANVPVGEHLADQLLIPMAMAGSGQFVTLKPSSHTLTNIEVIKQFMNVSFNINKLEKDVFKIEVGAGLAPAL